jgi:hypothetical protein
MRGAGRFVQMPTRDIIAAPAQWHFLLEQFLVT